MSQSHDIHHETHHGHHPPHTFNSTQTHDIHDNCCNKHCNCHFNNDRGKRGDTGKIQGTKQVNKDKITI